MVRGHLVWGHEAHTFTPCGGEEVWLQAGPHREAVAARYAALATEPYEPVYAELRGMVIPVPPDLQQGFPGAYPGVFEIAEVVTIRNRPDGCAGWGGASS